MFIRFSPEWLSHPVRTFNLSNWGPLVKVFFEVCVDSLHVVFCIGPNTIYSGVDIRSGTTPLNQFCGVRDREGVLKMLGLSGRQILGVAAVSIAVSLLVVPMFNRNGGQ